MNAQRLIAAVGGGALLSSCVVIAGPCDLKREPHRWSLSCQESGTALVLPPSTLEAIVHAHPASGAAP